jgi:hypothetical protein
LRSWRFRAFAIWALATVGFWVLVWAIAIAVCLPGYVTWNACTTDEGEPMVMWKLLEVGPYAWNGKIYDLRGREIIFFLELGSFGQGFPESSYDRRLSIINRRANHTVIEVQHRFSDEQRQIAAEEERQRRSRL